jgi:hypothetical protein
MATSDDLMQDVFANFTSAYRQSSASSATNIIAFEAIGLSPGLSVSAPDSTERAVEYVSTLGDSLPDLSTGVYERTMRTVSVTYEDMLNVSLPSSAAGTPTFNAVKATAQEAFANSNLGSLNGPTTFKPAYATPANWYDPSQETNWLQYSYSTVTPPPPRPVAGPVPVRVMMPMAPWRFTMAPTASTPASVTAQPRPMEMREATVAPPPVATPLQAPNDHPATGISNEALEARRIQPAQNQTPPVPPPPQQPQFSISFEYCIVELSRPWFSGDFLATPGWYVPGAHQGDYASGPLAEAGTIGSGTAPAAAVTPGAYIQPASAAAQPLSPAAFSFIPTAFIAIKNLLVSSTEIQGCSPSSQPVQSFGPFSLIHASGSTNALSDPGIQLIAWVCSTQPILPPDTDPALIVQPLANVSSGANTVGTVVNVLENIFGSGGNI